MMLVNSSQYMYIGIELRRHGGLYAYQVYMEDMQRLNAVMNKWHTLKVVDKIVHKFLNLIDEPFMKSKYTTKHHYIWWQAL